MHLGYHCKDCVILIMLHHRISQNSKHQKKPKKGVAFFEKIRYNITRCPGVAQLVARLTGGQEAVSSSLATRTILTKRYRCVWRKVRRINRFRAFSSPDFFSQTIDANRCFRASAPIRTGRFPVSCRCVQPAPFFSGDFSGWQRYFSQKRITKIWASFCWS